MSESTKECQLEYKKRTFSGIFSKFPAYRYIVEIFVCYNLYKNCLEEHSKKINIHSKYINNNNSLHGQAISGKLVAKRVTIS